jgi:hypothetical protein
MGFAGFFVLLEIGGGTRVETRNVEFESQALDRT